MESVPQAVEVGKNLKCAPVQLEVPLIVLEYPFLV